jgi:hypothetical protein
MIAAGLRAGLVFADRIGGRLRRSDDDAAALPVGPMTVRAQPATMTVAPHTPGEAVPRPESPAMMPPPVHATLPPDMVQRVAEQVVRSLDARALALRERFGRF